MKTITPVLWSRPTKNNEKKIYIRITENRKSIYKSLGISINPNYWLTNSGRISKSHSDHEKLNNFIENEIEKIRDKDIKRKKSRSYLDYHENFQNNLKGKQKFGSYKKFNTVYQHLLKFKESLYKADITFDDFDKDFLTKLNIYFTGKKIGNNSQRTYFKQIRYLLNEATKEQIYTPPLPLKILFPSIKVADPEPRCLSKDELFKIIRYKSLLELDSKSLKKDIDLFHTINFFLFSFFSYGMRFGDLSRLKWNNIQGDIKNQRIHYVMTKTGKEHSLRLFDQLVEILRFYLPSKLKLIYLSNIKDLYLFNCLSDQERNLLESNKMAGEHKIGNNITFYSDKGNTKEEFQSFVERKRTKIDIEAIRKFINIQSKRHPDQYIFPLLKKYETDITPEQFYKQVESSLTIYNHNLDILKNRCGITKKLSSHVARHSFSFLSLKEGANVYELSVSLNHQDLSTTQSYLKRDRSFIDESISEVYNKMFDK